tara:strand:- start:119 stop:352 length:234 start_codon:yes stop_codon:yes gene_type:complete
LLGVLTHAGHSYSTKDKNEIISISNIERKEAMASLKKLLNFEDKSQIISIGSTPTMFLASNLDGISELGQVFICSGI